MSSIPTTCPFCACGCGLYLLAGKEHVVGVAPSETHPVSRGKLCARGWCAHEAILWGNRLKQPQIRRSGRLEPASWADALDHLTSRIKDLIGAGKPVGVLGSARATNEENYLAGKLARAGFRTNNLDFSYHTICRSVLEGFEEVAGECFSFATLQDIESSEAILLLEGDLAESHPRVASSVLRALEKQARLVTIGCRRTQMARLASLHFPSAPGDEGEVINSLLAAAVRSGTEQGGTATDGGDGYDLLRHRLDSIPISEESGRAAAWIAGARRATFLVSPASGQDDQRRKVAAALATLAALTGHLKAGSGLLPLLARSDARGACEMGVAPDRLPGYEPLACQAARHRLHSLWGRSLPSDRGMDTEAMLQSVRGLMILADDPASVLPRGERARAALQKMEFVAVLDAFVTEAVESAHLALPIASFAETEGTLTNMEGRVQRLRVATGPAGEARTGWQVLAELCVRFGVGGPYSSAADVLREITQAVPRYSGVERVLADGWSETLVRPADRANPVLQGARAAAPTSAQRPYVLAERGAFDWGKDPLVSFSPTLSRDSRSERKLFVEGFVEICQQDADAIGVRAGRRLRLISGHGQAVLPIRVKPDLKPGVLLVPYAFRDQAADVLGDKGLTAVQVELA